MYENLLRSLTNLSQSRKGGLLVGVASLNTVDAVQSLLSIRQVSFISVSPGRVHLRRVEDLRLRYITRNNLVAVVSWIDVRR